MDDDLVRAPFPDGARQANEVVARIATTRSSRFAARPGNTVHATEVRRA